MLEKNFVKVTYYNDKDKFDFENIDSLSDIKGYVVPLEFINTNPESKLNKHLIRNGVYEFLFTNLDRYTLYLLKGAGVVDFIPYTIPNSKLGIYYYNFRVKNITLLKEALDYVDNKSSKFIDKIAQMTGLESIKIPKYSPKKSLDKFDPLLRKSIEELIILLFYIVLIAFSVFLYSALLHSKTPVYVNLSSKNISPSIRSLLDYFFRYVFLGEPDKDKLFIEVFDKILKKNFDLILRIYEDLLFNFPSKAKDKILLDEVLSEFFRFDRVLSYVHYDRNSRIGKLLSLLNRFFIDLFYKRLSLFHHLSPYVGNFFPNKLFFKFFYNFLSEESLKYILDKLDVNTIVEDVKKIPDLLDNFVYDFVSSKEAAKIILTNFKKDIVYPVISVILSMSKMRVPKEKQFSLRIQFNNDIVYNLNSYRTMETIMIGNKTKEAKFNSSENYKRFETLLFKIYEKVNDENLYRNLKRLFTNLYKGIKKRVVKESFNEILWPLASTYRNIFKSYMKKRISLYKKKLKVLRKAKFVELKKDSFFDDFAIFLLLHVVKNLNTLIGVMKKIIEKLRKQTAENP